MHPSFLHGPPWLIICTGDFFRDKFCWQKIGKVLVMCFSSVNLTTFANFLEKFCQFFYVTKLWGKKEKTLVCCALQICAQSQDWATPTDVLCPYMLLDSSICWCVSLCSWVVESLDLNTWMGLPFFPFLKIDWKSMTFTIFACCFISAHVKKSNGSR